MNPVSRTPEGEPNQCPVCGNSMRIEPSRPPGDAPCPHCGCLVWFSSAQPEPAPSVERARQIVREWAKQLSESTDQCYFRNFVGALVEILAAGAGAIWICSDKGLRLEYRRKDVDFQETRSSREKRALLLAQTLACGRPLASSTTLDYGAGTGNRDPRDSLLLVVPISQGEKIKAVVEIVHGMAGPATVREEKYRLLKDICDFSAERICQLATP